MYGLSFLLVVDARVLCPSRAMSSRPWVVDKVACLLLSRRSPQQPETHIHVKCLRGVEQNQI